MRRGCKERLVRTPVQYCKSLDRSGLRRRCGGARSGTPLALHPLRKRSTGAPPCSSHPYFKETVMNSRILVVAGLLAAAPIAAHAQQAEVVVAPVVVSGDVIRYEPGKTIVIKSDGREVTYMLTPELQLPAEVQTGRRVSVYSERGTDGNT